jgi:mannose-6-phosphate isomerase-like protein (cupin superfamily)
MKSITVLLSVIALVIVLVRSAEPKSENVTHFPAERVAAGFARGGPLLETGDYKIHTARRTAPGEAELHAADTDIFHIIDGSATFVTGGTISNERNEAPGEIRGKEITGGKSQRLSKGDVIVIPAGVPHWFNDVEAPLLYYVVKVTKHGSK